MRYSLLGFFLISFFPLSVVFSSPGLMGILTLLCSFISALLVGLTRSTWYGIMIWLVYISGLLIIFLFFCAMVSNPSFVLPGGARRVRKIWAVSLISAFLLGWGHECVSLGVTSRWPVQPWVIYQHSGSFMVLWIGLYLFLTMVAVVKVAPKWGGAVRAISYTPRGAKGSIITRSGLVSRGFSSSSVGSRSISSESGIVPWQGLVKRGWLSRMLLKFVLLVAVILISRCFNRSLFSGIVSGTGGWTVHFYVHGPNFVFSCFNKALNVAEASASVWWVVAFEVVFILAYSYSYGLGRRGNGGATSFKSKLFLVVAYTVSFLSAVLVGWQYALLYPNGFRLDLGNSQLGFVCQVAQFYASCKILGKQLLSFYGPIGWVFLVYCLSLVALLIFTFGRWSRYKVPAFLCRSVSLSFVLTVGILVSGVLTLGMVLGVSAPSGLCLVGGDSASSLSTLSSVLKIWRLQEEAISVKHAHTGWASVIGIGLIAFYLFLKLNSWSRQSFTVPSFLWWLSKVLSLIASVLALLLFGWCNNNYVRNGFILFFNGNQAYLGVFCQLNSFIVEVGLGGAPWLCGSVSIGAVFIVVWCLFFLSLFVLVWYYLLVSRSSKD